MLCLDRHQTIRHPERGPLPIGWILLLVWVISIAMVLPYLSYITHIDLSVSICLLFSTAVCLQFVSVTKAFEIH